MTHKMEVRNKGIFSKYGKGVLLVLGTVFISFGFILHVKFDALYDLFLQNALEFTPESEPYKAWLINDPPLVIDIYLFNWTNPKDIRNSSVKPKFEQVGPYKFLETKEKVNVTWHSNNTISYKYIKRYYFMENKSPRQLSDKITTINPVALAAAYKGRFWSFVLRIGLSLALRTLSKLYVTKTAGQHLFEGYEDDFLTTVHQVQNVHRKFGFFYKRNGSISTITELVHVGVDENYGRLVMYDGKNRTSFYDGKCGEIKGSSGEFYPLNSSPTFVEIYSAELCSSAHLNYEGNVTVKGVTAYKYGSKLLFDNGTINPENACYCRGECIPTGVMNVSSCRSDSPVFLSLPHFYNADPYYTSSIDGMHPNKENHELYISLQPKSSIVVDFALRVQINMLLQPIKGISLFDNVPKVFMPLVFFDQNRTMDDELAEKIKRVQSMPELAQTASIGMIISGGVVIGISILLFVFVRERRQSKSETEKMPHSREEIPLRSNT